MAFADASVRRNESPADVVKPLQPRILPKSFSKIGLKEMGERITEEEGCGSGPAQARKQCMAPQFA